MSKPAASLDAVLDSLADHAVFTLDSDGRVTSWNNAAEKHKGYSAHEVVGQYFGIFYTEEDRAAGVPAKALRGAIEQGRFEAEGWRVRKDGSRFWADVVIQPLRNAASELEGFVKVTRDVSERMALEKIRNELQQSQKLELVGQLTGGISHDFNNLLTAIEATFELIRLASSDERILRYLTVNRLAIDRSRKLIGQLLAFSRKQVLDPTASDVNAVALVFDALLQKAVGEQIQIDWRLDRHLPEVNIDGGHLQSALMNLVINARDAMPGGGTLSIFSELRHVSADRYQVPFDVPAGSYVAIGVTDIGHGMTPEVLARCLEPFFTTKDVGQGSGLGLSQCFGFARQSGGTLDIQSREGEGTTVAILLPVLPELARSDTRRRTVLLVEDDPAVRELAAELLRALGNDVVEAGDAAEALSLLQRDLSIDLLFTDIVMPHGTNGIQLLIKARELRPGLAAVLTSGYTRNVVSEMKELPEKTPFLRKPYSMDELRESLNGQGGGGLSLPRR